MATSLAQYFLVVEKDFLAPRNFPCLLEVFFSPFICFLIKSKTVHCNTKLSQRGKRKKLALTISVWEYFLEEAFSAVSGPSLICSHSGSLCFQGVLAGLLFGGALFDFLHKGGSAFPN